MEGCDHSLGKGHDAHPFPFTRRVAASIGPNQIA
jgi:hypothetical protein